MESHCRCVEESISQSYSLGQRDREEILPSVSTLCSPTRDSSCGYVDIVHECLAYTCTCTCYFFTEPLPSGEEQPLSPLDLYVLYLKDQYKKDQLPSYNKWPHVEGKKFINLCLLSKYRVTPQQAHQYTEAMFHGKVSSIDQNMTMEDIAKTDDGLILKGRQICILIEGAPGVGKSTLAWKLCHKWGKGEILQQYRVVLLLRLREKRVRQVKTDKDIFELCKPVAATKELCESHGEGVLLVLDGWDELPVELREEDSFFLDLLQGQVLPDAAVLVTSRPHASEIIVTECRDHVFQHIQIAGFTEENIGAFVSSNIGEDPELLHDFNTYLDSYPHIKSMMYNPLNAAIVVKVYKDCHNQKIFIPKTMTELYSSLTRSLLLRYLREHSEYGKRKFERRFHQFRDLPPDMHKKLCIVSELAYEGITNQQQVIFDNLPDDFDSLGLMQCIPELYVDVGAVMSYNFLHLTIQEYFAAYHMSQQSTEEQVKMLKLYQNDTSMKMVLKLFVGLTNFDGFSDDFLISLLEDNSFIRVLSPYHVSNVPILSVDGIHFLFEAKQRIKVLNTQPQVQCHLSQMSSPFDYYVLGYVMSHSSCKWVANFMPELNENVCLMMFAKGASSNSPVSVEHPIQLDIIKPVNPDFPEGVSITCLNHLASSGSHFLKRVKRLRLHGMVLHEDSYELFSSPHLQLHSLELIQTLHPGILLISLLCEQNKLRNLTNSSTSKIGQKIVPFAAEEHEALCKWLSSPQCSLRTLNIWGNDLSLKATKGIVYSLRDNCTLEDLDLSSSSMSLEALSTQLPLVTLSLSGCKLDSRTKELCRSSILAALDLCSEGGLALAKILKKNKTLKKLDLLNCNLMSRETGIIATALCNNSKLVDLDLSFNPIGDEGVIALAEMLKKNKTLKKLNLSYCWGISQAAVQTLQDSNSREIELNLEHLNEVMYYILRDTFPL